MVDRTPSLENEKVYDRDAGDTIPLSGSTLLVNTTVSPSIWTWSLDI
jgi:hypothetical protein